MARPKTGRKQRPFFTFLTEEENSIAIANMERINDRGVKLSHLLRKLVVEELAEDKILYDMGFLEDRRKR